MWIVHFNMQILNFVPNFSYQSNADFGNLMVQFGIYILGNILTCATWYGC